MQICFLFSLFLILKTKKIDVIFITDYYSKLHYSNKDDQIVSLFELDVHLNVHACTVHDLYERTFLEIQLNLAIPDPRVTEIQQ